MSEQSYRTVYVRDDAPTRVDVDPNAPWANWPEPDFEPTSLRKLQVRANVDERGLHLVEADRDFGPLSSNLLQQLGWKCKFPHKFINTLSPLTQERVVNECIEAADDAQITVITENGQPSNICAGWREVLPYRETAQFIANELGNAGDVEVSSAACNGHMQLQFLSPVEQPITQRVGDVLRAGVSATQCYGTTTEVALYVQRLVCLNGATSAGNDFKWTSRTQGLITHQLSWLRQAVRSIATNYNELVARARQMASISFTSNPHEVLEEHARAMGFPKSRVPELIGAFEQEPGQTEWDIWNAFTRWATHMADDPLLGARVQRAAGEWAQGFEIVNARLPRPVAIRVGAQIIPDEIAV